MLRKYYTADFVKDGNLIASIIVKTWFYKSPWNAWDDITEYAINKGGKAVNFRRIT